MKKKIIIVFILGIIVSIVIDTYLVSVIKTNEVSYKDNKNIKSTSDLDYISGVYSSSSTLISHITNSENNVWYIKEGSCSNTNVASGTITTICTISSLPSGIWIIYGYHDFATSFTSSYNDYIYYGSSGGYTVRQTGFSGGGGTINMVVLSLTSSNNIYYKTYHTVGSTVTARNIRFVAVRIRA